MLEYRYDTQLLIEGESLDEGVIIVVEDMERQSRGLKG